MGLSWDPYASIGNSKLYHRLGRTDLDAHDGYHDFACFGEFHGIADENLQHLPETPGVSGDAMRHIAMDRGSHGEPLLVRGFCQGRDDVLNYNTQLELDNVEGILAGFDLREIQYIVNEDQKIVAAFLNSLGIFTLLIV